MEKIQTLFERNEDGNITKEISPRISNYALDNRGLWQATEKLDGTNIRVTMRNDNVVRVEKRRNPNRKQKDFGIIDPWYTDANEQNPEDAHIFAAVHGTNFIGIPDGEWSGEAIGTKHSGKPFKTIKK